MNERRTQGVRTISTQTRTRSSRTFRSGPYLHGLLTAAERVDAFLQRQICARIKQARTEAGFTQEEMADLLGMTMRGYQNYESERVPWRKLGQIAELAGVTEMWLIRGDPAASNGANPAEPTLPEVLQRLDSLEGSVESLRQVVLRALGLPADEQAAH
jgi:transcriptional regulator with XRE-family HTH domain